MMPGDVLRQILRIGLLYPPTSSGMQELEDKPETQWWSPTPTLQEYQGSKPKEVEEDEEEEEEEDEEIWGKPDEVDLDEDDIEDLPIPERASL